MGIKRTIRIISNGEQSVRIYEMDDGSVRSSDNNFFANINDSDLDDAIEVFEDGWRETHWNRSDWADYYGCDEDEVSDCMDDDLSLWEDD